MGTHPIFESDFDHIQVFIDRFRYNANRAAQVQSKIKGLEKLPPLVAPEPPEDVNFSFSDKSFDKLDGNFVQIDAVSFRYSAETRWIFKNMDLSADSKSRIAIVGENGAGKSTLLKLLLSRIEPSSGYVKMHRNLRVSYFAQHHIEDFDLNLTPIETLQKRKPGMTSEEYRRVLGRFGCVNDLATRKMMVLSGGQKSRVAFACLAIMKPHLLILDEPTNHLDVETVAALAKALEEFQGGVVLVSPMARITLHHHRGRLEHRVGDLRNAKLLVVSLLRRDDRGVGRQHKVDARVRHEIRLELGDVDVEGTVEAERRRQGRDHLRQKAVKVRVRRPLDVQVPAADIVEGFVVNLVRDVSVLQERVHAEHGVVRLNARRGDLRARPHGERDLRLLAVVHREALQKQAAETRPGASTAGVEHHEALEARAVVSELAEAVQHQIHDLLANRVVATGEVVGGILLAGDQLLRMEQPH